MALQRRQFPRCRTCQAMRMGLQTLHRPCFLQSTDCVASVQLQELHLAGVMLLHIIRVELCRAAAACSSICTPVGLGYICFHVYQVSVHVCSTQGLHTDGLCWRDPCMTHATASILRRVERCMNLYVGHHKHCPASEFCFLCQDTLVADSLC